jgi:hypothetical protein
VSRSGDSRSVTLRLVAPTDEIAALFKSLVGPEITVTDTRSWEPDGAGGYRGPMHVEAIANGRTATISGVLSLTPDGCSTSFTALANVSLKVRLIGGARQGCGGSTRHRLDGGSDQGAVSLARPDGLTHLINNRVGPLCQRYRSR